MAHTFSDVQIRYWRQLKEQFEADTTSLLFYKNLNRQRLIAQSEMVKVLSSFLKKETNLKDFQAICDRKTQQEWHAFGLAGYSGGLFLDKLILYTPNQGVLEAQMRYALHIPQDLEDAHKRMRAFWIYLNGWIKSDQVTTLQLQPNRVPFYLSSWWHIQSMEKWPIFYDSARDAFKVAKIYKPTQNYIEDYFAFRENFLSLAKEINIGIWDLEHICAWKMNGQK